MRVVFQARNDWPEDALVLEPRDPAFADGVALAVHRGGIGALRGPADAGEVRAPDVPTFDDLLALWLIADPAAARVPDDALEALCEYGKLARQGLTPGTAPLEHTPRAVLDQIRSASPDPTDPSQARALLERSGALFLHLGRRVADGEDLLGDGLFPGTAFREEILLLARDRELYLEDRRRGLVRTGRLAQGGVAREVDLLVLEEPASLRFAEWARRDADAPHGQGFALLLVRWPNGAWVLSSDPPRRLALGALAAALQAAEVRKRGGEPPDPWYDGSRHRGTLVAAPRAGTALSRDEILAVLQRELSLRTHGRRPPLRIAAAAAAVAAVAAVALAWPDTPAPPVAPPSALPQAAPTAATDPTGGPLTRGVKVTRTAAGAEAAAPEVVPLYHRTHALVIGIAAYAEPKLTLSYARKDAEAVRDALADYAFDDVTVLFDEAATREAILTQLESYRGLDPNDALFVFWAGHGFPLEGSESMGHLVPYDGTAEQGRQYARNIAMKHLRDLIAEIPAKHKFVVVDACHSGQLMTELRGTRGARETSAGEAEWLREITSEPTLQVLASGKGDQEVLDGGGVGGHSVFAAPFLAALAEPQPYVTASQLEQRVGTAVFEAAREHLHAQRPVYAQYQGHGDFVFVRRDSDAVAEP